MNFENQPATPGHSSKHFARKARFDPHPDSVPESIEEAAPQLSGCSLPSIPEPELHEPFATPCAGLEPETRELLARAREQFGYMVRILEKEYEGSKRTVVLLGEEHYTKASAVELHAEINSCFEYRAHEAYKVTGGLGSRVSDQIADSFAPIFSRLLPGRFGVPTPRWTAQEFLADAANIVRLQIGPGEFRVEDLKRRTIVWRDREYSGEEFAARVFRPGGKAITGEAILAEACGLSTVRDGRFLDLERGHRYSRSDRISFWAIPALAGSLLVAAGASLCGNSLPVLLAEGAAMVMGGLGIVSILAGIGLGAFCSGTSWYRKITAGPCGAIMMSGYLASRDRTMAKNLDGWVAESDRRSVVLATVGKLHLRGIIGILRDEHGWREAQDTLA